MHAFRFCVTALATAALGILLSGQTPASSLTGDPARGKTIYLGKGNCQSCHRVNGAGSRLGPDLSDIGAPKGGRGSAPAAGAGLSAALETSILDPDADVALSNRLVRVVMKDGTSITGRLLNHDNYSVQMIDPQGKLRSFQKADLKESTVLVKGLMPSYKGRLSDQEVADVVAYLSTLKGLGSE
jgi:putative heme-binding domain-containing protein